MTEPDKKEVQTASLNQQEGDALNDLAVALSGVLAFNDPGLNHIKTIKPGLSAQALESTRELAGISLDILELIFLNEDIWETNQTNFNILRNYLKT